MLPDNDIDTDIGDNGDDDKIEDFASALKNVFGDRAIDVAVNQANQAPDSSRAKTKWDRIIALLTHRA
jgi:hypothetical protein